jgi:hypothetical protein
MGRSGSGSAAAPCPLACLCSRPRSRAALARAASAAAASKAGFVVSSGAGGERARARRRPPPPPPDLGLGAGSGHLSVNAGACFATRLKAAARHGGPHPQPSAADTERAPRRRGTPRPPAPTCCALRCPAGGSRQMRPSRPPGARHRFSSAHRSGTRAPGRLCGRRRRRRSRRRRRCRRPRTARRRPRRQIGPQESARLPRPGRARAGRHRVRQRMPAAAPRHRASLGGRPVARTRGGSPKPPPTWPCGKLRPRPDPIGGGMRTPKLFVEEQQLLGRGPQPRLVGAPRPHGAAQRQEVCEAGDARGTHLRGGRGRGVVRRRRGGEAVAGARARCLLRRCPSVRPCAESAGVRECSRGFGPLGFACPHACISRTPQPARAPPLRSRTPRQRPAAPAAPAA